MMAVPTEMEQFSETMKIKLVLQEILFLGHWAEERLITTLKFLSMRLYYSYCLSSLMPGLGFACDRCSLNNKGTNKQMTGTYTRMSTEIIQKI